MSFLAFCIITVFLSWACLPIGILDPLERWYGFSFAKLPDVFYSISVLVPFLVMDEE